MGMAVTANKFSTVVGSFFKIFETPFTFFMVDKRCLFTSNNISTFVLFVGFGDTDTVMAEPYFLGFVLFAEKCSGEFLGCIVSRLLVKDNV